MINKELGSWFVKDVKKQVREKWKWNHDELDVLRRERDFEIQKMVEQIVNIEQPDQAKNMPVSRYFANTFGDLLNDAMYEL